MLNVVLSLVLWVAVTTSSESRECDNLGVLVYEDMNCKPVHNGANKCPSKYECPQLTNPSEDLCYFRSKTYRQGDFIHSNDTYCQIGCSCQGPKSSKSFLCAIGECGQFGPPLPEGCYFEYDFSTCCGGSTCPTEPVQKCTYDNVEYKEGERFFPNKSCSMCICQKGFKGIIEEPFCIPRQCEGQIRFQKEIKNFCAPVYRRIDDLQNDILCCPNEYLCPDGKEVFSGLPTSAEECRYGAKTIKVGQEFKKEINRWEKFVCKCTVPPLVTCVPEK
ncbi:cysteine-rich motor neuron 1 protein isoform X1 [Leptinotarsa decemlineata]|uniref:cysteine-rich motor neuron 1 protein isoform X1 n=2 Tax=Leptinotarsa decemlineata TaxID=7539 RepID=UPI003D30A332